jgi:hypothetical protein
VKVAPGHVARRAGLAPVVHLDRHAGCALPDRGVVERSVSVERRPYETFCRSTARAVRTMSACSAGNPSRGARDAVGPMLCETVTAARPHSLQLTKTAARIVAASSRNDHRTHFSVPLPKCSGDIRKPPPPIDAGSRRRPRRAGDRGSRSALGPDALHPAGRAVRHVAPRCRSDRAGSTRTAGCPSAAGTVGATCHRSPRPVYTRSATRAVGERCLTPMVPALFYRSAVLRSLRTRTGWCWWKARNTGYGGSRSQPFILAPS